MAKKVTAAICLALRQHSKEMEIQRLCRIVCLSILWNVALLLLLLPKI